MFRKINIAVCLLFMFLCSKAQNNADHHFVNEYKEWNQKQSYYDWKVYLVANDDYLNSIKEIDYYLDPSFRKSTRSITVKNGGKQFTLCANGWAGFTIRIRIIFKANNKPDLYELFPLDLKTPSKRNNNFQCNFKTI